MSTVLQLVFLLTLAISIRAVAGPLEEGHAAFDAQRYAEALRLWQPLAEQGDAEAQYNLALLYKSGLGIKQDERKALEWFHKAARQGMSDAQYNIGVMFYEGKGAYRSEKSAIEWWALAAADGHANAQYNLGVMYGYGIAMARNTQKALELWQAAAEQGHPDAIDALINAYQGHMPGIKADPKLAAHWQAQRK